MKFGGTSLSDRQARQAAYRHVQRELKAGKVLVVVSAMGRCPEPYATDTLLKLGSPLLSPQEKARLLSLGELLSSLRVSGELLEAGIDAYALPIHQSGIITDSRYDYAHVCALHAQGVQEALTQHEAVVACGFIANDEQGNVTTLGRGGSDFSAVLFAQMLQLPEVNIYTDVDAVYSVDPRVDPTAFRHERLSYEEMLRLHSRVLHERCVRYARAHQIRIHLRGTFSDAQGTLIS